ncbi:hypothetical protein Tco_0912483 [Tanacetum coccineum]
MYSSPSVGRFDVFFCNQLLGFQQHQDESLYDSWTRFKDIIRKVLNHGLTEGDSNPTSTISNETIANPNAQIVGDDMVRVQVPRCMTWLNYDEHVDSLSTMDNEVTVTSPKSTIQTLPSFEEYTSPVTYLEEVEKTLGTSIEVEPLNETKLEEVG